jgi:hypothetical protein
MNARLQHKIAFALLALAGSVSATSAASTNSPDEPRGGRVGWARLITPHPEWNRHARSDDVLSTFIREKTSLNIDPTWYSADPAAVDQLCQFPLIFTNDVVSVKNPNHLENLREYLHRGGFLLIDACSNTSVNPDPDKFLARHTALLTQLVPKVQVRALPATHEIYHSLFTMRQMPPHVYYGNRPTKQWSRHGLYGAFDGDRMIALISLSGLQCGWDHMSTSRDAEECMRMIVNIYVYAMTRAEDVSGHKP